MMAKRIVVLGGGESGFGAAVLALKQGFEVFMSDSGALKPEYVDKLGRWGIEFEQGGHTMDKILSASEIVKSPGIPDKAPVIGAAHAAGIPVISEIEFAGRYCTVPTICITGSNGKTTTTTLIHKILTDSGIDAGLAGNIGRSFAYQVAEEHHDWYVIELSSFQLDGMFDFRADVAVLMNITPDHLDRYDYRFENYVDSKFRVTRNQRAVDSFIYCSDCPTVGVEVGVRDITAAKFPFSKADIHDGVIDADGVMIQVNNLKVKGLHNAYNVMAAAIAARRAGVDEAVIRQSVDDFGGVEHRLEFVCRKDGVTYINDSKATNVDSVWYALESMSGPTVWIAGGTDKGNDYEPIKGFVKDKVKALVCMGVDNEKLKKEFDGVVPVIFDTHSLEDAVSAVQSIAVEGDTVLLSPACASFDLFSNYEDRGVKFKNVVRSLK